MFAQFSLWMLMLKIITSLVLFLGVGFASCAYAQTPPPNTLFVDGDNPHVGSGQLNNPLNSIPRALQLAREDSIIFICGIGDGKLCDMSGGTGTYQLDNTIVLPKGVSITSRIPIQGPMTGNYFVTDKLPKISASPEQETEGVIRIPYGGNVVRLDISSEAGGISTEKFFTTDYPIIVSQNIIQAIGAGVYISGNRADVMIEYNTIVSPLWGIYTSYAKSPIVAKVNKIEVTSLGNSSGSQGVGIYHFNANADLTALGNHISSNLLQVTGIEYEEPSPAPGTSFSPTVKTQGNVITLTGNSSRAMFIEHAVANIDITNNVFDVQGANGDGIGFMISSDLDISCNYVFQNQFSTTRYAWVINNGLGYAPPPGLPLFRNTQENLFQKKNNYVSGSIELNGATPTYAAPQCEI